VFILELRNFASRAHLLPSDTRLPARARYGIQRGDLALQEQEAEEICIKRENLHIFKTKHFMMNQNLLVVF
jgi:hypothetical protein